MASLRSAGQAPVPRELFWLQGLGDHYLAFEAFPVPTSRQVPKDGARVFGFVHDRPRVHPRATEGVTTVGAELDGLHESAMPEWSGDGAPADRIPHLG